MLVPFFLRSIQQVILLKQFNLKIFILFTYPAASSSTEGFVNAEDMGLWCPCDLGKSQSHLNKLALTFAAEFISVLKDTVLLLLKSYQF